MSKTSQKQLGARLWSIYKAPCTTWNSDYATELGLLSSLHSQLQASLGTLNADDYDNCLIPQRYHTKKRTHHTYICWLLRIRSCDQNQQSWPNKTVSSQALKPCTKGYSKRESTNVPRCENTGFGLVKQSLKSSALSLKSCLAFFSLYSLGLQWIRSSTTSPYRPLLSMLK